ncbi:MAG: dihydroorotase [Actinomycetota bacterium]|nr:dihydroorotase [Actinomycetota bacterium]
MMTRPSPVSVEASPKILIRGGAVLTPSGFTSADVAIDGGRISAIGESVGGEAETVIEATGCLIGPGFVDVHVHFREPGRTWKEDIESGSAAAAAGGFTAVVNMPNTDPPIDDPKVVNLVASRGRDVGLVEVSVAAALTRDRNGTEPADIEALYASGVRIFSDDGDSVVDGRLLKRILERVSRLDGALVAQHAEDHERTRNGHMHEGEESHRLGIAGLSSEAETDIVRRDIELVRLTGCRYHCQHVSTKETAETLRAAKAEGLPITAEVTPHHLSFIDEDVERVGTNLKMYPPVRTGVDRLALREALRDGTIDMVATDHAPHTEAEKAVPFGEAPRGVIGLETAAAVANETLDNPGQFFEVMSIGPARLAGMTTQGQVPEVGLEANLVVFHPTAEWTPESFVSKSQNSPYRGMALKGMVLATIYKGRITHRGGPTS